MKTYVWKQLCDKTQQEILMRPRENHKQSLCEKVKEIIASVRADGDDAIKKLTYKFDQVDLNSLSITPDEFVIAHLLNAKSKAAIDFAYQQIRKVYATQIPHDDILLKQNGISIVKKIRPIQKIGLYIPGGQAPLVSTVLMLGVLAKLASCPQIILCTPPDQQAGINPYLIYAAQLCGIEQIFKVGGAQAIAAMAYGSESIPKVDKIFGPGNSWVTEAKNQIAQDPSAASIDLPAGPSEVLVIADDRANPDFVAADLLAQAEHSTDAQVILIARSQTFTECVLQSLQNQMLKMPRQAIISQALRHSRIILVDGIDQGITISNRYAPEHLILHVDQPDQYIEQIQNAGTVFLGEWAPETLGDYVTGSNHVLPTDGQAKTFSGLSVLDFMKYINFQLITTSGLESLSEHAIQLASLEGMQAHKNAIEIRRDFIGTA